MASRIALARKVHAPEPSHFHHDLLDADLDVSVVHERPENALDGEPLAFSLREHRTGRQGGEKREDQDCRPGSVHDL